LEKAICHSCIEDTFLSEIVKEQGKALPCAVCGKSKIALTITQLANVVEPVLRQNLQQGENERVFGEDDDDDRWEQEGESLAFAVQRILGQYFDFEDELIEAICAIGWDPRDGDGPYWDSTQNYVETPLRLGHLHAEWDHAQRELQLGRRFFSPSSRSLFERIFKDVDTLKTHKGSVVRKLPKGQKFLRARLVSSDDVLRKIVSDPYKHVGPPPSDAARAGRMNAEGIAAFYGARQRSVAIAELRPAIGNEVAVITVETTASLRLLDFQRLSTARSDKGLSYFQPDFEQAAERLGFIRRLHRLITQPILPGKEREYLITQTMAEYLAYIHPLKFDGILFASAQKADGVNVALFNDPEENGSSNFFRLRYKADSLKFVRINKIEYRYESTTCFTDQKDRPHLRRDCLDDDIE
jgi:hypothetical protein